MNNFPRSRIRGIFVTTGIAIFILMNFIMMDGLINQSPSLASEGDGMEVINPPRGPGLTEEDKVRQNLLSLQSRLQEYRLQNGAWLQSFDRGEIESILNFNLIPTPNYNYFVGVPPNMAVAEPLNPVPGGGGVFSIDLAGGAVYSSSGEVGSLDLPSSPVIASGILSLFPTTGGPVRSSVAAVELDGNPGKEIVVASDDGKIYAWHQDGTLYWDPPVNTNTTAGILSSPAIDNINNNTSDGKEVVIGTLSGKLYVLTPGGANFDPDPPPGPQWPKVLGAVNKFYSSAVLANLNNDSQLEILINSFKNKVYCFKPDGSECIDLGTGYQDGIFAITDAVIYSSPAVGDLDHNDVGQLEVIVGDDYGKVYAWNRDGTTMIEGNSSGLFKDIKGSDTRNFLIRSSPVLADIDGDGELEVIVVVKVEGDHNYVYIFNKNAQLVSGWDPPKAIGTLGSSVINISSSPAVGNIADFSSDPNDPKNKDLEVVIADDTGHVYAWHDDGTPVFTELSTGGYIDSSVSIADINGDGNMEIVVGAQDGKVYAWHNDGTPVDELGFPTNPAVGPIVFSSPSLDELNSDNIIELLIGSTDYFVYNWQLGTYNANGLQWPKFRHDLQNTGTYLRDNNQIPTIDAIPAQNFTVGTEGSFTVTAYPHGTTPNGIIDIRRKDGLSLIGAILDYTSGNNSATFRWTPAAVGGPYALSFQATDQYGLHSAEAPVNITVFAAANHAPTLDTIGNRTGSEGALLSFVVRARDQDSGDTVSITVSGKPSGSGLDPTTNPSAGVFEAIFHWTPDFTQAGAYNNIIFTATDNHGATDTETITITINDVNQLPILDPIGNKNGQEGTLLSFPVRATDPDGDPLNVVVTGNPPGSNLGLDTNLAPEIFEATFSWTPNFDQAGTYYPVTFTAVDTHNVSGGGGGGGSGGKERVVQ